ncbi:hypothetical protein O181_034716 [Austropuccinia psidii MF-1]|uniref:Uncharacterized protein n=1 Tax=Austropuccinia psidii MF-1 TaxID=1389203 RepID=A0A9Q3D1A0_9BASI|nr:hypothetical protein [Austropuccinia psidii MF-1]
MQEPYRAADQSNHLQSYRSNFAEWVAGLTQVLCISLNSELLVNNCPSFMENRSPQENREISHFINATILPNYTLCIGVIPVRTMAKEFFNAIKARCCPDNCFQKLKVVQELLKVLVENGTGHPHPNPPPNICHFKEAGC